MIRILFLVLVAASVASSASSVKGIVVGVTGKSVFPAQVQLLDPVDQKILYETKVGPDGFHISPVTPQSYFVIILSQGFMEYTDGVSVAQDQAADMGRMTLHIPWNLEERPTPSWPEVRWVSTYPMMTVCEYLNLRSAGPLSYQWAIVVGILERTPQGTFLRQSCRDSLRSGDYSWPNAIALEDRTGSTGAPDSWIWADLRPRQALPSTEDLDPRDRGGNWAAFLGRLQTRDKLVAVPCGTGKQCAYGFGAISAPARLLYQKWFVLGRAN